MADKEKKVAEATNKPQKSEKKKGKIKEAWRGLKSECKKIVWPTWKQVVKNTAVVLIVVVICAILIGALDYVFSQGITALANLFTEHTH